MCEERGGGAHLRQKPVSFSNLTLGVTSRHFGHILLIRSGPPSPFYTHGERNLAPAPEGRHITEGCRHIFESTTAHSQATNYFYSSHMQNTLTQSSRVSSHPCTSQKSRILSSKCGSGRRLLKVGSVSVVLGTPEVEETGHLLPLPQHAVGHRQRVTALNIPVPRGSQQKA